MDCFFCGHDFGAIGAGQFSPGQRMAFDPWLGRLWGVCPQCQRWSVAPLDTRWEVLEACERAARGDAAVLLQTEHLCLLRTRAGDLIRVGQPPRSELAGWRYSSLLDSFVRPHGFFARILNLPVRPVGGNIGRDYHGGAVTVPLHWIGSPFLEMGGLLTALFSSVPLASSCPSCRTPLFIAPHTFGDVRLTVDAGSAAVVAECAMCESDVMVALRAARPALRTGMAMVSRTHRDPRKVSLAVAPIDRAGGATECIHSLARLDRTLGTLTPRQRLALWISLDEAADAEALESEWRQAEQLASISDGELTQVPGFVEFRARVLGEPQ